jgi:hypothetical protein
MKPIDYSKTVMYKIVSKDLNSKLIYIGHTTNFRVRKSTHKTSCCNINDKAYNYKVYKMIRDNGGWDEWEMLEIEKYACNDVNEARTRERYWYELYNANLNSRLPISSQKEYCKKNKDAINQMVVKWKIQNREKINENSKKYREKNKDVINAKAREKRLQKNTIINT